MPKYLSWFLNGFAVTFAIPSILIMISWNAIPGDTLYPVKTGLEGIALGVTINTPLAPKLTVKYTERRFTEANQLLSAKGSTVGYDLLVQEARNSSTVILDKNDSTNAEDLIKKIEDYKVEISQKRTAIASGALEVPTSSGENTSIVVNPVVTSTQVPIPETNTTTNVTVQTDTQNTAATPVATSYPTEKPISTPSISVRTVSSPTPVSIPKGNEISAESEVNILTKLDETEAQLTEISDTLQRKLPVQVSPHAGEAVQKDHENKRNNSSNPNNRQH